MAHELGPQEDAMNNVLSADELERLKQGLDGLADTMPPRAVWHRIRAQAEAEGLLSKPVTYRRAKWLVGAAIAAAVALAVLRLPETVNPNVTEQLAVERTPSATPRSAPTNSVELNALMVQSQQLEQDLRAITYQPRMMRASTAAIISNLEDQIASIDYRLNHPAIRMSPANEQLYWRERVRLMESLVKLRYAQVQRASF
jgi:hypothetical protein